MQKFLQKFITICVIVIGVVGAIEAIQHFWPKKTAIILSGNYFEDITLIAHQTGVVMNEIAPYFNKSAKASPEEVLDHVTQAKKELITLNAKAKSIQPPATMKPMHQQFTASLDNYVTSFSLTEEGLKDNDNAKLDQAGDLLFKGAHQMKGVAEEMARLTEE